MIHSPTAQTLRKTLAYNAAANGNSGSQDCRGFLRAIIDIYGTSNGTGTITAQVQEAPDNATWVNVANATVTVPTGVTGLHYPIELNLTKRQRYLRVVWSGYAATISASADIHLFSPEYMGQQGNWDSTPVVV